MVEHDYKKDLDELCEIADRMKKRNEQRIEKIEAELGTLEALLHRTEDSADV